MHSKVPLAIFTHTARLAVLASLATIPPPAVAETQDGGLPEERGAAIDRFVDQFVDLAMFDGTVLIDIGGKVLYENSFGYASYELKVRHDEKTRFRIASVSKSLTDAAVAAMIRREAFTLETPISTYLPDFPSAAKITIGHLLDHTSGIAHTNSQPWGDGKTSLPLDEIVKRLSALPLDFDPGTRPSYSNGGYAVLAKILEIVGEGTFSQVMRETVFDPLDMKDTDHIADARTPIPGMATGYEPGAYPGERRHSRFYAVEMRPGGGSFYSTARDLLRFARGVLHGDFIGDELRRKVVGADDGVFLSQGRSPGFVAKLYYDPKRDLTVVSVSNSYAVPADWAAALANLAIGDIESESWPQLHRAPAAVSEDDPRLGRYRSSRGWELAIERGRRGAMFISDAHSNSIVGLVPLTDGAFILPIYFQRCEQDPADRNITCRMLSGTELYKSEYSPLGEPKSGG